MIIYNIFEAVQIRNLVPAKTSNFLPFFFFILFKQYVKVMTCEKVWAHFSLENLYIDMFKQVYFKSERYISLSFKYFLLTPQTLIHSQLPSLASIYIYTELPDNVKQAFGILIQKKSLMVKINYRLIEDCTKVLTTVYMTLRVGYRSKLELVLLKDFAEENRSAPVG